MRAKPSIGLFSKKWGGSQTERREVSAVKSVKPWEAAYPLTCSWTNWNHGSPKPKVKRLRKLTAALLDKEERLTEAGNPRVFVGACVHTLAH